MTVPSGRGRTVPVTATQNSLRSVSAIAKVAARSGSQTTCTRPSRSRRSMKMTPPWSRRRWTQPVSVDGLGEEAAVDETAVVGAFHGSSPCGCSVVDREFAAGAGSRSGARRGYAEASHRCPVNFGIRRGRRRPVRHWRRLSRRMNRRPSGACAGRHDAHGDHVLQRLVHGHVEFAHPRLGHDDEIARGRIRRRRHIDRQMLLGQVRAHRRVGGTGEEGDRPRAGVRKLDQQRLAKRVARVRQQRVADLLDRRVDRFHDGNAAEHRFPHADQPRTEEIGGDDAGDQQDDEGQQDAETRECGCRAARSGRARSGNSSSVWSSVVTRKCRTQMVMPSGTQTRSPAIR